MWWLSPQMIYLFRRTKAIIGIIEQSTEHKETVLFLRHETKQAAGFTLSRDIQYTV
jgi:hypothetical protein